MVVDVEKFIKFIYSRTPLWDQKDSNHHNRFVLDKLWEEVGKEFKITRNCARSKWKGLRDKFRMTLSRIQEKYPDELAMECYQSNWPQFQDLLFLRDQFINRKISGNAQSYTDTFDYHIKDETSFEPFDPPLPLHVELSELPIHPTSPCNINSPSSQECKSDSQLFSTIYGKRFHSNDEPDQSYLETKKQKRYLEGNEDMNFFSSILPHIKDFTSPEKLSFRIKVMQLVQDIVIEKNSKINEA